MIIKPSVTLERNTGVYVLFFFLLGNWVLALSLTVLEKHRIWECRIFKLKFLTAHHQVLGKGPEAYNCSSALLNRNGIMDAARCLSDLRSYWNNGWDSENQGVQDLYSCHRHRHSCPHPGELKMPSWKHQSLLSYALISSAWETYARFWSYSHEQDIKTFTLTTSGLCSLFLSQDASRETDWGIDDQDCPITFLFRISIVLIHSYFSW